MAVPTLATLVLLSADSTLQPPPGWNTGSGSGPVAASPGCSCSEAGSARARSSAFSSSTCFDRAAIYRREEGVQQVTMERERVPVPLVPGVFVHVTGGKEAQTGKT